MVGICILENCYLVCSAARVILLNTFSCLAGNSLSVYFCDHFEKVKKHNCSYEVCLHFTLEYQECHLDTKSVEELYTHIYIFTYIK